MQEDKKEEVIKETGEATKKVEPAKDAKKKEKKSKVKENPIATFEGKTVDLTKFNILTDKEQYAEVKKILEEIYDNNIDVTRRLILKVISLTLSTNDDYIYLPYNLKVSKEKLSLKFNVVPKKRISTGLLIFAIWLLVFAIVAATYAGIRYLSLMDLNKDIDGDGIADINVDINGDEVADINIDTSGDNIPNINVDYKGNRRAIFAIDYDEDGIFDYNPVNLATDRSKICKLNCDINGDGWPDLNIDLDGDGKPDVDIDTDNDWSADLNLDLDGDGMCDVLCDTDGDGIADKNLVPTPYAGKGTGTSKQTGDPQSIQRTSMLILSFIDGETINLDRMLPTDQQGVGDESKIATKTFTIENLSPYDMEYDLKIIVSENEFFDLSDHFEYSVSSSNGGYQAGFIKAPNVGEHLINAEHIKITKGSMQKYTVRFRLRGDNEPQDYEQGKAFGATFKLEV